MNTKKVFIKNFGCQMNIRDSEFVTGLLLEDGFKMAKSAKDADVILFNSCSVRKHAEDRLFSNIAQLRSLKEKKRHLVIGLMGCTAQNYKDKILERAPLVDIVCGPQDEYRLAAIIKDVAKNRCPIIATGGIGEKRPEQLTKYRDQKFKTFVSIGEGCDNFCSYCIVPYVRGRERSRDAKDIIREVRSLADRGFKEITLLGQNVNSYGRRTTEFIKLLTRLNSIDGIERIRFMTSHPKDVSIDLFKAMRDLENLCEHLHLPLQSASDRILKLMNRGYTKKEYLKLVENYKRFVPVGSITTDVIVGFPSETERDFEETFELMKDIRFDSAFTFKYSPRPPARSAKFKDNVGSDVKEARLKCLSDLQCEISRRRNERAIGKTVEVLVEDLNERSPSLLTGRTRTNKIAIFAGSKKSVGKLADIKIEEATPYALKGRIVG